MRYEIWDMGYEIWDMRYGIWDQQLRPANPSLPPFEQKKGNDKIKQEEKKKEI